jgi:FkbH-like protein
MKKTNIEIQKEVNLFEKETSFDQEVKIYFLRNYTVENIDPFLKHEVFSLGFKPHIAYNDFNVITQNVLDKSSDLYTQNYDVVVLSLYLDIFDPSSLSYGWDSKKTISELRTLFSLLKDNISSKIVLNTFVEPLYPELGITNSAEVAKATIEIAKINTFINQFTIDNLSSFVLVDWNKILRVLGEERSFDYRFWYSSKSPFKPDFSRAYAFEISKVIKALKGKTKKCVVLDCDNTIWGGIVGEDGIDGIKLDNDTYPGKAFYDFQKKIVNLHKQGILITLCSKNNEEDVFEVLEKHPNCLIKKEHLSAWRINWQDKSGNILELAKELNIGLDSFVFFDDNEAECAIVKDFVPDVEVVHVPKKPYLMHNILHKDGFFETLQLSKEDANRTKLYQEEKLREENKAKYNNIEDFLKSLDIEVKIVEIPKEGIPRVAQLTQKTNQFNLTTKRYSEDQIGELVKDKDAIVLSIQAKDKYGDMGITGVAIVKRDNNTAVFDTFLLSCRVLSRKIEDVFINKCFEVVNTKWEIDTWSASYIPTKKNSQVKNLWDRFGFEVCKEEVNLKQYSLMSKDIVISFVDYIKII